MADLKPCPFCGESLALYQPRREGDDHHQHPTNDCVLASTGLGDPFVVFDDPKEIAAWNRRAHVSGVSSHSKAHDAPVSKT